MNKQTLIIIPGWGGNEGLWQNQIHHLHKKLATKIVAVFDKKDVAEMANAILDIAPVKFHLAGHSLGGWVAQEIALTAPERLFSLTLLSTWTGASSPELKRLFSKMLRQIMNGKHDELLDKLRSSLVAPSRAQDEKLLKQIQLSQQKVPPEGLINQLLAQMHSPSTDNRLHSINTPTQWLHGAFDSFFPLEQAQKTAQFISQLQFRVLEDCGHMPSLEQPQLTTDYLREHCLLHAD